MVIDNKKAGMALSQIFLLVIGTIAFAFAMGSQMGFVRAEGETIFCDGSVMGILDVSDPNNLVVWEIFRDSKIASGETCASAWATFLDANPGIEYVQSGVYTQSWDGTTLDIVCEDGRSFSYTADTPEKIADINALLPDLLGKTYEEKCDHVDLIFDPYWFVYHDSDIPAGEDVASLTGAGYPVVRDFQCGTGGTKTYRIDSADEDSTFSQITQSGLTCQDKYNALNTNLFPMPDEPFEGYDTTPPEEEDAPIVSTYTPKDLTFSCGEEFRSYTANSEADETELNRIYNNAIDLGPSMCEHMFKLMDAYVYGIGPPTSGELPDHDQRDMPPSTPNPTDEVPDLKEGVDLVKSLLPDDEFKKLPLYETSGGLEFRVDKDGNVFRNDDKSLIKGAKLDGNTLVTEGGRAYNLKGDSSSESGGAEDVADDDKMGLKELGKDLALLVGQIYVAYQISEQVKIYLPKVLKWVGIDDDATAKLISDTAAENFLIYKGLTKLAENKAIEQLSGGVVGNFLGGGATGLIPIGPIPVAMLLYTGYKIVTTKATKEDIVNFQCMNWQPPGRGEDCDQCTKKGIEGICTEYQCRSLGAACELINRGTDEQNCVWANEDDRGYPLIEPWEEILSLGYVYTPEEISSPPDYGVRIKNTQPGNNNGCIPALDPVQFGVKLDEPAVCKYDLMRTDSFDEMGLFMGGSVLYRENHSHFITMPGAEDFAEQGVELTNGEEYGIYVRCKDKNDNFDLANFVFKFCIEEGPDATPPLIYGTDWINNAPIQSGVEELDIELYYSDKSGVSECKWDRTDKPFADMENDMVCGGDIFNLNAYTLYECTSTLTGLKDDVENKFYFKCKDKPSEPEDERNTNDGPYELTLVGTKPLVISSVSPENDSLLKDSSGTVEVEFDVSTSAGYDLGNAVCYYSATGNLEDYSLFDNTESYRHSTSLWLEAGSYIYYISCHDDGGNFDTKVITFDVESDTTSPLVVRAFHESSYLKIITNEESSCVYSDSVDLGCDYSYDDGIAMNNVGDTEHYTQWNTNINYYIKCKDEYGNEPWPNACSITVRPMEI